MSMKDLNKKLEKTLKSQSSQSTIIKRLDELIEEFGIGQVNAWRNLSNNSKNTLLHELVDKKYLDVVRHVISKYNLRIFFKRELDGATPLELARCNQDWKMYDLLIEFGDDKTLNETYEQFANKKQKDKMMNIIWIDLEFTSFINPKILECAVIITDKELNEIERNQWIVHFDQDYLDQLGEWHQNAFKSVDEGGNGLFNEVVISKMTKEQMEDELLDLLKRHCPEKACPLAGSSIHIDKEIIKVEMSRVHDYLHYRVIDVSSFREMMKRWAPGTASKFIRQLALDGGEVVSHRAMDDIIWSIQMMKMFKPLLTSRQFVKKGKDEKEGFAETVDIRKKQLPIIFSSSDLSQLDNDEKDLLQRIELEREYDVRDFQLSNNEQRIYDQNPHLREVFLNNEQLIYSNQEFNNQNRKLGKLSLNRSLSSITNSRNLNTTEYWKQRKLLLTEIEFLTNYGNIDNSLVIYVGAASATYLLYLSSLFPQLKFILIDQKPFLINENDQIKIINQNLTDQLAMKYYQKDKNILFISHIPTFSNDEEENVNDLIRWHNILKPYASLYTLTLPRTEGITLFFEGNILFDLWSSKVSIQSRLVVEKDAKLIEYNHLDFERAMKHFHNVTRTMFYEHDLDNIEREGLDHCYDCRAEIFILQEYLIQIKQIDDQKQFKKTIAQLSYDISRNIINKNKRPIINALRTLNIIT